MTNVGFDAFDSHQTGDNHEIEASCSMDELDRDMNCEGESAHNYSMFKVGICSQIYILGLEFYLFKEFKQALKNYSVLNWIEVIFIKNDDIRVRVVCKKKCRFFYFMYIKLEEVIYFWWKSWLMLICESQKW